MAALPWSDRPPTEQSCERRYKIYTKTGDKGTSSLYNGERRAKTDLVFQALGDVDELNAAVGLAGEYLARAGAAGTNCVADHIPEIQSRLLDVGSAVATPAATSSERKVAITKFPADATARLEKWIDTMDEELPALTAFILPSGGLAAAQLHVARTLARRAERAVVALREEDAVDTEVAVYMNRLSDYFFCAARYASLHAGATETTYQKAR